MDGFWYGIARTNPRQRDFQKQQNHTLLANRLVFVLHVMYVGSMFYTYIITNLINSKRYFGVRRCEATKPEFDNKYWGSGALIKAAIGKYGRKNFKKEIDGSWDEMEQAYAREAEVVNEDWVRNPNTYNLRVGGDMGYFATEETRRKISEHSKNVVRTKVWGENLSRSLKGRKFSADTLQKMKASQRERFAREPQWNEGSSAKGNPSMSRHVYEITTSDGDVIVVKNGIETFYLEKFGTTSNLFRRYINKGKIPPVTGKGKGKASHLRVAITGWEVKRLKKL